MPKNAFLVSPAGAVERLSLTGFATEAELHDLVEKVPALLDECLADHDGEWLVVGRELGIPDTVAGADRWSVDLFLLDNDGTPTFVEVKRASDPRSRREVIAQMLEYAANGASYWSIPDLRQKVRDQADKAGTQPALHVITDDDSDTYWSTVESKLRSGQVRLVFVADRIPRELRRLIEFLNEKMPEIQVLALEVRLFKVGDRQVVIGEAVGNTARSLDTKNLQAGAQPAPASLEEWLTKSDQALRQPLTTLFETLRVTNSWQKLSSTQITYSADFPGGRVQVMGVARKAFWLALHSLQRAPVFSTEEARRSLLTKLEKIMGKPGSTGNLSGYPSFDISLLCDDNRCSDFCEILP